MPPDATRDPAAQPARRRRPLARIPVRLDDAASAARTLRRHMPAALLAELARLLADREATTP